MRGSSPALPCAFIGASLHSDGARNKRFDWSQIAVSSLTLNMGRPSDNALLAPGWESRAGKRVGRCIGFALLGESLLAIAPKGTKRSCPCIRVSLRSTSLIPSALRGPAYKGHPCRRRPRPFTPLAASMPLVPLRSDSIRPPERGVRRRLIGHLPANKRSAFVSLFANFQTTRTRSLFSNVGWKTAQHFPPQATTTFSPDHGGLLSKTVGKLRVTHPTDLAPLRAESIRPSERSGRWRLIGHLSENKRSASVSLFTIFQAARSRLPSRRPSAGVAQGDARHGCRARSDGSGPPSAWMSLRDDPRSSTGAREVLRSKTRMQGCAFFCLLFFAQTKKSKAPCEAQPVVPAEESAAPDTTAYASIDHPNRSAVRNPSKRSAPRTGPQGAWLRSPRSPNASRCPYSAGSGTPLRINPDAPQLPSRGDHP